MRALVVDDAVVIRRVLTEILESMGFEVETARDGLEALRVLEDTGALDILLVDWNMPRMDGIELCRTLRARPEFRDIPFVMVTARTEMDQVAEALDTGVDDYVMKPFDEDVIKNKLELLGFDVD